MGLTRADLESRQLQRMMLLSGLHLPVLSEAELQASIAQTLKHSPPNSDIWLFAYGSLIWNPIFQFCDRRVGKIYGWHRQFSLWAPLGRGTPEHPGLVLSLERGGSCRGVAYRIAARDVSSELLLLWRREMVVESYIPRWVKVFDGVQEISAIAFVSNPCHSCYAGDLPLPVAAHHIATAGGQLGSCADYLLQTVEGLFQEGIPDRSLALLNDQVQTLRRSLATGEGPLPTGHFPLPAWTTKQKAG